MRETKEKKKEEKKKRHPLGEQEKIGSTSKASWESLSGEYQFNIIYLC